MSYTTSDSGRSQGQNTADSRPNSLNLSMNTFETRISGSTIRISADHSIAYSGSSAFYETVGSLGSESPTNLSVYAGDRRQLSDSAGGGYSPPFIRTGRGTNTRLTSPTTVSQDGKVLITHHGRAMRILRPASSSIEASRLTLKENPLKETVERIERIRGLSSNDRVINYRRYNSCMTNRLPELVTITTHTPSRNGNVVHRAPRAGTQIVRTTQLIQMPDNGGDSNVHVESRSVIKEDDFRKTQSNRLNTIPEEDPTSSTVLQPISGIHTEPPRRARGSIVAVDDIELVLTRDILDSKQEESPRRNSV